MRIPVAREGWPFVLGLGALAVALAWARIPAGAIPAAALAGACALFFRDPERRVPADPLAIVSPADGRVLAAEQEESGARVSIFLSILDVHVNRSPVSGRVGDVVHTAGRFLAAFDRRAPEVNEQTRVTLQSDRGPVVVKQIAGLIARRVVCRVKAGDSLRAGERFGLIRFGSRTDVMLPAGARLTVAAGERVRGGETVIGTWQAGGQRGGSGA